MKRAKGSKRSGARDARMTNLPDLSSEVEKHVGEWVVIANGRPVAFSKNFADIHERAKLIADSSIDRVRPKDRVFLL